VLSAGDIFQFFFGDRWLDSGKRLAVLCMAYVDDSSDAKQEEYVIACAVIGSQLEWNRVFILWDEALRKEPAIKYFHSLEWRSLSGEFAQFRDNAKWPKPLGGEAADSKRDLLRQVVAKSELNAILVSTMMPDYERVRAAYPDEVTFYFGNGPFEAAFQSLLFECGTEVGKSTGGNVVGFICDENEHAVEHTKLYLDFKKKNPKTAQVLAGIGHFDDKHNPGVQAADLVAHLANQLFRTNSADGPFPHPQERIFFKIEAFKEKYALALLKANGVEIRER
jgi:hypothetical protein